MEKWCKAEPSHYVGMDFSGESVTNAIDRLKTLNPTFPSIFIVNDAGDENNLIDHILSDKSLVPDIEKRIVFDIVSSQFAMHYLFESEKKLRAFLRNVSDRLEPGGYFVGTTVDAERVIYKIRTEGKEKLNIGNRYYRIQFAQDYFPKEEPLGIKYYFYLKEAIGNER